MGRAFIRKSDCFIGFHLIRLITYSDTTKLERDYGIRPHTELRKDLREFREWYSVFFAFLYDMM